MRKIDIINRVWEGISGLTIIWSKKYEISGINPNCNDMRGMIYKRVPPHDFITKKDAKQFVDTIINNPLMSW